MARIDERNTFPSASICVESACRIDLGDNVECTIPLRRRFTTTNAATNATATANAKNEVSVATNALLGPPEDALCLGLLATASGTDWPTVYSQCCTGEHEEHVIQTFIHSLFRRLDTTYLTLVAI